MDRAKYNAIRADLVALKWVFADLEKKHGVKVDLGHATIYPSNVVFKLEVCDVATDGTVMTPEADAFKVNAHLFGLKSEDLGRSFRVGLKTYVVKGLRPRAYAKPIICEQGGKEYIFPAETVKAMLAVQKAS